MDIAEYLGKAVPKVDLESKRLVLPDCRSLECTPFIYGSDNTAVVGIDGEIRLPYNDMEVALILGVKNTQSGEITTGKTNVFVTIPGMYTAEEGDNKAPETLPSIREWKGKKGNLTLSDSPSLLYSPEFSEKAGMFAAFCVDMLGMRPQNGGSSPEVEFVLDKTLEFLGDEGYTLEISDKLTVRAPHPKGAFYGGVTVVQILSASPDKRSIPKGKARDYPKYKVRSLLLDVGRAWTPMEYLTEITKYIAYFKINDLHLHINDWGGKGYEAFRLESDFEGLAADDGFYTKKEYREYQLTALKYGIEIATEVDTPAHSKSFARVKPPLPMIGDTLLDVRDKRAVEFTKKLIDEYIKGDEPCFATRIFDIGTDEYPREYSEEMRVYCDELIRHINDAGGRAQVWAMFGAPDSYNGTHPVCGKARASYAAPGMQNYRALLEYGFDVINAIMFPLYIVPGGNWNFADYLDYEGVYDSWEATWFDNSGVDAALRGDPQFLGAKVCLWNDLYTTDSGFSVFDIFDRFKGGAALIAEKTWYGEAREDQSKAEFGDKVRFYTAKVPCVNPGRVVKSKGETLCKYDFASGTRDLSGNGHNAAEGENISLPFLSVGFPYTASFKFAPPENIKTDFTLFGGRDGRLFIRASDRKLIASRGVYVFEFDYIVPAGGEIKLTISSDNRKTLLVEGDKYYYDAISTREHDREDSTTFVLPAEEVSKCIKTLEITGKALDGNDFSLLANPNLAYRRKASASGYLVNDGRFTADMAVDGIINRSRQLQFSRRDDSWLEIDLGKIRSFNRFEITFSEHVPEYKILVSDDGEFWREVYHLKDGSQGDEVTDKIDIPRVSARFIKYCQVKMWYCEGLGESYSGGIEEFEVYGHDFSPYFKLAEIAEKSGKCPAEAEFLKVYLNRRRVYKSTLKKLCDKISKKIT